VATSFDVDSAQATRWFHALSDRTRLEIIGRLAGGECCVCELTDALDAAQSRLSFHLRTLKDAGLVTDRRDGRWIYYTLNRETLEEIEALVGALKSNARGAGTEGGCCG
jgi:ArsR family transcriptional regulator